MAETELDSVVTLAIALKQAREEQALSLETVADKLNLSVEQVNNIETNQQNIAQLSPFERGYIRNYAHLLGLDITPFANEFPDGAGVGSELHSVQRYNYKVSKPIASRGWIKKTITVFFILVLIFLLAKSGISLDTLKNLLGLTEISQQEMTIENEKNAQLTLPPQQDNSIQ